MSPQGLVSAATATLLPAALLRTAVAEVERVAGGVVTHGQRVAGERVAGAATAVAALRPRGLAALLLAGLADAVVMRPAGLALAVATVATGHGGFLQMLECVD